MMTPEEERRVSFVVRREFTYYVEQHHPPTGTIFLLQTNLQGVTVIAGPLEPNYCNLGCNGTFSPPQIKQRHLHAIEFGGYVVLVKFDTPTMTHTVVSSMYPPANDPKNVCAKCMTKGTKMQVCGRCKKERYCSVECQKDHWVRHKVVCEPKVS